MDIKKQVTVITDLSQREETNAKVFSSDMTLEMLYEFFSDLREGDMDKIFDDKKVNHIVLCLYDDYKGEGKRRIGGFHKKAESKEELMDIVKQVSESLRIKITRSLELLQNPKEL